MSPFKDPWVILGVDRDADDAQIKKAYRQLAKINHPDRNPGDKEAEARFQDISAAFKAIGDEESRLKWLGEHEKVASPFTKASSGPSVAPKPPSAAERYEVKLNFRQAYSGATVELDLEVEDACSSCGGSGAAPGTQPYPCPTCKGAGSHEVGRVSKTCSDCAGKGFKVDTPCPNCKDGLIRQSRPFQVPVPAGIADGQVMRMPAGAGGEVLITIRVEESPIFKRMPQNPSDLVVDVPITFAEACLGAQVKVPTPAKTVAMTVPASSQQGTMMRLPGLGMPRQGDGSGDLYARLHVVIPEKLSMKQKGLVEQMARLDNPERMRYDALFGKNAS